MPACAPSLSSTLSVFVAGLCFLKWSAWLRQRENEWPEQVNLTFASDEQNDEMVFSAKVEEKKLIVQWERFSIFNRLVNTMAYVQRLQTHEVPICPWMC